MPAKLRHAHGGRATRTARARHPSPLRLPVDESRASGRETRRCTSVRCQQARRSRRESLPGYAAGEAARASPRSVYSPPMSRPDPSKATASVAAAMYLVPVAGPEFAPLPLRADARRARRSAATATATCCCPPTPTASAASTPASRAAKATGRSPTSAAGGARRSTASGSSRTSAVPLAEGDLVRLDALHVRLTARRPSAAACRRAATTTRAAAEPDDRPHDRRRRRPDGPRRRPAAARPELRRATSQVDR